MKESAITRRGFLQAAAVATAGTYLTKVSGYSRSAIAIRPNVSSFTETSTNMLSYAKAVKEMRARSAINVLDPLGWTFWANIHGKPASDPNFHETWEQCDHGTRWFFPWHRGYLMFFERAIRKVSGDSNFVLPYWKWDDSTTRSLPSLFRMPMHAELKELFHPRFPWINDGTPLPNGPFDVDLPSAMDEISFDFISDAEPGFSLSLDSSPHGPVHTRTGGEMRSIATSARDPIFWLHHCNVDRLWNRWLDKGMGRKNPSDADWLDSPLLDDGTKKPIRFPDETGAIVQLTVKEVLEMAKATYRYDDDPVATAGPASGTTPAIAAAPGRQETVTAGSASHATFALSDQKAVVAVSLGNTGSAQLNNTVKRIMTTAASAPKKSRVVLEIQGIKTASMDPEVDYSVFIRPKGSDQEGEYVGTLHFFSVHQHKKSGAEAHAAGAAMEPRKFDTRYNISSAVKKLTGEGNSNLNDIEVIFQPSRRPEGAKPLSPISFERIVVQTVRN